MAEIVITKENYEREVLESGKPSIIEFWSERCGPCLRMSSVLSSLAERFPEINVYKINADDEEELSDEYDVYGLPMIILFKDKKVVDKSIGYMNEDRLISWMKYRLGL